MTPVLAPAGILAQLGPGAGPGRHRGRQRLQRLVDRPRRLGPAVAHRQRLQPLAGQPLALGLGLGLELDQPGGFVTFFSYAANLLPADTNDEPDIFIARAR